MKLRLSFHRNARGILLIDCAVYIAVLSILLTLGFGAFIETVEQSTRLERMAQAIVRATHAGEQWRADIRQAATAPRLRDVNGIVQLDIPTGATQIVYTLSGTTLFRSAGLDQPRVPVLDEVKVSHFHQDRTDLITSWRWELEMVTHQKTGRSKMVFTFMAVPQPQTHDANKIPAAPK